MLKNYNITDCKLVENGKAECPVSVYVCPDDNEKKYLIDSKGCSVA